MDVSSVVRDEMRRIGSDQNKNVGALEASSPLMATGLDSLCFAILVARLEERFGVDPFSAAGDLAFPVTVGDLITLYDDALVKA